MANNGVSSVLRTASSLATQQQTLNDDEAGYTWTNSAKTISDYNSYRDYIQSRIDQLSSSTTPSSAIKAASFGQKLHTITNEYVSAEISRQSSNVMEGNASLYDKMNVMQQFYTMASNPTTGDPNLAQSLRGRIDSLNVQIQSAEIASANASKSIADANSKAQAGGYNDAANAVEAGMQKLTAVFHQGGTAVLDKAIQDYVKDPAIQAAYKAAGIPLDAKPDIGSLYEGGMNAIAKYKTLAASAIYPYDPNQASQYSGEAMKILNGETAYSSPFGSISIKDAQGIAANPNLEIEHQVIGKSGMPQYAMQQGDIAGWTYDKKGNVVPVPAGQPGTAWQNLDSNARNQIKKQLEDAGFTYKEVNNNLNVYLTDKTSQWLNPDKFGFNKNEGLTLIPTSSGLQLMQTDASGKNTLMALAFDRANRAGLYKLNPSGQAATPLAGQYGFNQSMNNVVQSLAGVVNHVVSTKPSMLQRQGGGFNFTDPEGNPVSAYTYAKLTNQPFRSILSTMAAKGDSYAAQALPYAGNDAAYNPSSVPLSVAHNWTSLTWGNPVNLQIPQAARTAGGADLNYFQNLSGGGGQTAAPSGMSISHL